MTHYLKFEGPGNGTEFQIHSYDFHYTTDHSNGMPAEHGSVATLRCVVHQEAQQDSEGTNFKVARTELWTAAKSSIKYKNSDTRSKITLRVKQVNQPERMFELNGWLTDYHESAHGLPGTAENHTLEASFYVFPVATGHATAQDDPALSYV